MRLFVMGAGDFRIIGEKEYEHFISKVIHRPPTVPLITVSNHRSMMDDPGVLSCILPFWMSIQPRYLKWSLCAQEFCFNSKVKFYSTHNVAISPPPFFFRFGLYSLLVLLCCCLLWCYCSSRCWCMGSVEHATPCLFGGGGASTRSCFSTSQSTYLLYLLYLPCSANHSVDGSMPCIGHLLYLHLRL